MVCVDLACSVCDSVAPVSAVLAVDVDSSALSVPHEASDNANSAGAHILNYLFIDILA